MTWARENAFYGQTEEKSLKEYMDAAGPRYGGCDMGQPMFHLPHQCDEWVIGDADDMREFIAACQLLLDKVIENNELERDNYDAPIRVSEYMGE
jgi:hypothetical protein